MCCCCCCQEIYFRCYSILHAYIVIPNVIVLSYSIITDIFIFQYNKHWRCRPYIVGMRRSLRSSNVTLSKQTGLLVYNAMIHTERLSNLPNLSNSCMDAKCYQYLFYFSKMENPSVQEKKRKKVTSSQKSNIIYDSRLDFICF